MVVNNLNSMGLAGLDLLCRHIGLEVDINDGRIIGYTYPKNEETPGAATPRESM